MRLLQQLEIFVGKWIPWKTWRYASFIWITIRSFRIFLHEPKMGFLLNCSGYPKCSYVGEISGMEKKREVQKWKCCCLLNWNREEASPVLVLSSVSTVAVNSCWTGKVSWKLGVICHTWSHLCPFLFGFSPYSLLSYFFFLLGMFSIVLSIKIGLTKKNLLFKMKLKNFSLKLRR